MFTLLECPDRERVILAMHFLRGAVGDWWRLVEETTLWDRDVQDVTWAEFKTLFLRKFFPRYSRDRRYQEFLSLSQGDSSVEEYTSQFLELRRYAPHWDESDMAMRYISGLAYRIRIHVVSLCCETVDRAIAAAMSVEAERELFRSEHSKESSKGKSLMLSRSRSTSASQAGSTSGPSFGKRLVSWVVGSFIRDQSKSQTTQ